jgi:hypothetical protein
VLFQFAVAQAKRPFPTWREMCNEIVLEKKTGDVALLYSLYVLLSYALGDRVFFLERIKKNTKYTYFINSLIMFAPYLISAWPPLRWEAS